MSPTQCSIFLRVIVVWMAIALWSANSRSAEPRDLYGDPLPPGVLARMGSIRLRHAGPILDATFSPNGKILAATSKEGKEPSLHLWDVRTGRELPRLAKCDSLTLSDIKFSPDGKLLACLDSSEKAIYLWNVASGDNHGAIGRHTVIIAAFAFSPDGRKIAVGGEARKDGGAKKGNIYLWDVKTQERLHVLDGRGKVVDDLAFTADGKTLLSASGNGVDNWKKEVCLWDVASGKLRDHYRCVHHHARFAPNGATFVTSHRKRQIRDAASERDLWVIADTSTHFVYSPDGKFLLIHQDGQPCRLWEAASGKEVRRFPRLGKDNSSLLCLSSDGATLATSSDCSIRLWDTKTGQEHRPAGGHQGIVGCLDFAPDGRTLVSGGEDGTVRLWETTTGKQLRTLLDAKSYILNVAFSPDGKLVAAADSNDYAIHLFDAASCKEMWRETYKDGWSDFRFTPESKSLVVVNSDGAIHTWDVTTHKRRLRYFRPALSFRDIILSPDCRFASVMESNSDEDPETVDIWDLPANRRLCRITGAARESFSRTTFSPDGKIFVALLKVRNLSGGVRSDYQLRFWETETGKVIRHLDGRGGNMKFSPDGAILFTDGLLSDPVSGVELGKVSGHLWGDVRVAFSHDGRLLASGGDDGTILIHAMSRLVRLPPAAPLELSERELLTLWDDLASSDAARGWKAVHKLMATPQKSVPFLQRKMQPQAPADQRRLDRLLADLDSDQFAVREAARKELLKLGDLAVPALRKLRDGKPSLEVRRQVLTLLEQIHQQIASPEALRASRATAVLERIDTADGRDLLRRLAGGAAEARLTRDAAASLERLKRRESE